MPKITIAIPTYNRREFLRDCLNSVLNQTFRDFEVIIFDNHSDYDIQMFLNGFKDPRISLVGSSSNLGGLGNFSRLFKYPYATDYIMAFHDDDTMHPDMLRRQAEIFKINPGLGLVVTGMNFVKDSNKMADFKNLPAGIPEKVLDSAGFVRLILSGFNVPFNSALYRREALRDFESLSMRYGKRFDRPFMVNASKQGGVGFISERLVNYRLHKNQDSQIVLEWTEVEQLAELCRFYRDSLPQPLSLNDQNLFYSFSTNNWIRSGLAFVRSKKELKSYLRAGQAGGLLKWRKLNVKGFIFLMLLFKKTLMGK